MSQQYNVTHKTKFSPIVCYPNRITSGGIFSGDYPFDFSVPLLLSQVTLVMITINVVRFILKPLKQPSIVSDVIAGILVGPSGLGRSKRFADTMFPRNSINDLSIGAMVGIIYCVFLMGVKQDATVIVNSGKGPWVIAILSSIAPFIVMACGFLVAASTTHTVQRGMVSEVLVPSLSLTSFASLHPILVELNLLNSKLGRLAMSASTNIDVVGFFAFILFGALNQASSSSYKAIYYLLSLMGLSIFIIYFIRPLMFWIVHHTPEGKPVDRAYIVPILLGVLVIVFIGDFLGIAVMSSSLMLGLAMPDGPPLGAAIVDKTETLVESFFLPVFYAFIGLRTDVFAIKDWAAWVTLNVILFLGYIAKVVGTIIPSWYFKLPFYDGLSLGLIMNFRGLADIFLLVHLTNYKIMDQQSYTTTIISLVAITGIATPLVRMFSQHSKPYTPYGLRTIQHSKPNRELRILTCIHTQEDVPAMINLLEASNATTESPVRAWNLNLVELVGRAYPMLISHAVHRRSSSCAVPHVEKINNAFKKYEQECGSWISIQSHTSVSPYKTMHQDICMLALDKKVSLVILPFYKQQPIGSRREGADRTLRNLNYKVLEEAPCSVGILVDQGQHRSLRARNTCYHICVIFLGGNDDREALSYGARMISHPRVKLDVVRILRKDQDNDTERESLTDDKVVAMFRIKCTGNERVLYKEERVDNSEETLNAIRCKGNHFDLMIVGLQHDSESMLVKGLSQWCENQELGVIGDFIVSSDFYRGRVSLLVMQQQINVGLSVLDQRRVFASNGTKMRTLR